MAEDQAQLSRANWGSENPTPGSACALSDLGLGPSEVWTVGDNLEWEVAAPQRLGSYSIWNDYKAQGLPRDSNAVPDRVIYRISELIEPE